MQLESRQQRQILRIQIQAVKADQIHLLLLIQVQKKHNEKCPSTPCLGLIEAGSKPKVKSIPY